MRRAVVLALVAACAAPRRPAAEPAARKPELEASATGALLAHVPAGAQGVLELDVARLRGNDVIGRIIDALGPVEALVLGYDPLRDVDALVIASFDMGEPRAGALVLVRGRGLDAIRVAAATAGAEALDEHTLLLGPDDVRDRARSASDRTSVRADGELMALRGEAVPPGAPGASLRVYARIDPGARVAIASTLGVDEVPSRISIWGDVADDAAIVIRMRADSDAGAQRIASAIRAAEPRLARLALAAGIPFPQATLTPVRDGASTRITWVVGPKALARWADEVVARLARRSGAE